MTAPALSQISLYPTKSLGGLDVSEAFVEHRGLRYDRRWMLVDDNDMFLTQRELPRMACVGQSIDGEELTFTAPGQTPLSVALTPGPEATSRTVRVWRSVCRAQEVSADANRWFSHFLGRPCRLVVMPDDTRRLVNPDFAAGEGIVSFADGYPLLLLGEASLDDLNARLAQPVPMNRFRPNLVVAGTTAFAEDDWEEIRIGTALFHVAKPCARCLLTTVDQEAGVRQGDEPLRTLASYRRQDQKVLFGQLLIPLEQGIIQVGDSIEVQKRRR